MKEPENALIASYFASIDLNVIIAITTLFLFLEIFDDIIGVLLSIYFSA